MPILKTHELGLPQSHEWQKDVLTYISKSKVLNKEDDDFQYIENKICPGQTIPSIKHFVRDLKRMRYGDGGGKHQSIKTKILTEPLYLICSQRLEDPQTAAYYKRKCKLRDKRIKEVVDIYNTLSTKIREL